MLRKDLILLKNSYLQVGNTKGMKSRYPNDDDFYMQTFIEHNYNKFSGNNYLFKDTFHPDVRIVHYAGN